jgi:spore germination protein (amino acid permease)
MELEKGKIGNYQLIFMVLGFFWGISIILSPGTEAKHDSWIAILLGMIEGIVLMLSAIFLGNRFKGKSIIQISETVFGTYIGKLISLLFLWYLLHLGSLVMSSLIEFLSITVLPRTPDILFSILLLSVSTYAVRNGIEVIARCSQVLVPLIIGLFFLVSAFLIKNFNLKNFLPVLDLPIKNLLMAAHGVAIFPFADSVAFLMVIPFLKNKPKMSLTMIIGLIIGGILLVLQAAKNTGLLGSMAEIYVYQNFQADRLINVGNLLSRVEIMTVLAAVSMSFVKITILLYATVLGSAQWLGLRSYRPLIIPLAIFMIILAQINFTNLTDNLDFVRQIYPVYAIPFQVGIPLITLIVALMRGLPEPGE